MNSLLKRTGCPIFCGLWCEDVCGLSFNHMGQSLSTTVNSCPFSLSGSALPALASSFIMSSSVHSRASRMKQGLCHNCPAVQPKPTFPNFDRGELSKFPQGWSGILSMAAKTAKKSMKKPSARGAALHNLTQDSTWFKKFFDMDLTWFYMCQLAQAVLTCIQLTTMSSCYAQPIVAITNFTLCPRFFQISLLCLSLSTVFPRLFRIIFLIWFWRMLSLALLITFSNSRPVSA